MASIQLKSSEDLTEIEYMLQNTNADIIEVLAEWIIRHYQEQFIRGAVRTKFDDFTEKEKEEEVSRTIRSSDEADQSLCKEMIQSQLRTYFSDLTVLNIEGFITFRLKDYKDELAFMAEECVYEYIALREYEDIMDLLRYFQDAPDDPEEEH